VVAGMGGYYNLPGLKPGKKTPPPTTPQSGADAGNNPLTLEKYNDTAFGFLRITVSPASITGEFVTVDSTSGKTGNGDSFTVDLKANTVSNGESYGTAASLKSKSRPSTVSVKSAKTPAKKSSKTKKETATRKRSK